MWNIHFIYGRVVHHFQYSSPVVAVVAVAVVAVVDAAVVSFRATSYASYQP